MSAERAVSEAQGDALREFMRSLKVLPKLVVLDIGEQVAVTQ